MRLTPVLLPGLLALSAATSPSIGADIVRQHLDRTDARHVIAELHRTNDWNDMLSALAKGDNAWITLAPRLAAGTDGADSESLVIALARALPKAPRPVLAAGLAASRDGATSFMGLDRICGLPFIEPSAADLRTYRSTALRALKTVHGPASAACMRSLS